MTLRIRAREFISLLLLLFVVLASAVMVVRSHTKTIYLEHSYLNQNTTHSYEVRNSAVVLEQPFFAPYDIIEGVSLGAGTIKKGNCSKLNLSIVDPSDGTVRVERTLGVTPVTQGTYERFSFGKNVAVTKGEEYVLRIEAEQIDDASVLAFEAGKCDAVSPVVLNGDTCEDSLCFAVFGGERDVWWTGFILFVSGLVCCLILRGYLVTKSGIKPFNDALFCGMAAGIAVVLLLSVFSGASRFADESDNILGGSIIARGGVLYRDYVVQHTPLMYYLCGLFRVLGARSVEQFRIAYYVLLGFIWGLISVRNMRNMGGTKMLMIAVSVNVFVPVIIDATKAAMVISDSFQAVCAIALLLELVGYFRDKSISWKRSLIVSAAIWGSIGVAVISVVSMFPIGLAVLVTELRLVHSSSISLREWRNRLAMLFGCLMVPPVLTMMFFGAFGALGEMYQQAFAFNTQVYPHYNSVQGDLLSSVVDSIKCVSGILLGRVSEVLSLKTTYPHLLELTALVLATAFACVNAIKCRTLESMTLLISMVLAFSRGNNFHATAGWAMVILIIVVYCDRVHMPKLHSAVVPAVLALAIFFLHTYLSLASATMVRKQEVSDLETYVVASTDDNEGVFLDAFSCDAVYLAYKHHYPINRACYILPWYMEWFEQAEISDLQLECPKLAIYNSDQVVVNTYSHFCPNLDLAIRNDYSQIDPSSPNGWKALIWIRRQSKA